MHFMKCVGHLQLQTYLPYSNNLAEFIHYVSSNCNKAHLKLTKHRITGDIYQIKHKCGLDYWKGLTYHTRNFENHRKKETTYV